MVINNFRNEYAFLSNFYQCKITYKGFTYNNVEAAFQAQKDLSRSIEFCNLSPVEAKHLGRKVHLRSDWEEIKLSVMLDLIRIKFQDKALKQLLLDTGDAELIEGNTWNDYYWGICRGRGNNYLGKILMKVREELS